MICELKPCAREAFVVQMIVALRVGGPVLLGDTRALCGRFGVVGIVDDGFVHFAAHGHVLFLVKIPIPVLIGGFPQLVEQLSDFRVVF